MKFFRLLLLTSICTVTGVVEISPSRVAPVCQVGDQLELMCNTTGIDHRWEFVIFPENETRTSTPVTSIGMTGIPQPLMISSSMITFSRLSGQNVLPLISRVTIDPVSSDLNGTVVNCVEGMNSLVATTIIKIIDSQQFELSTQSDSEDFLSDGVTITLEWTLVDLQPYYQQFLRNISVSANPQPKNVMFTGDMRVQLTLSYNTLYNVSVTQHSTCRQLSQTKIFELNFSKCGDPLELTNALAVDYVDPALEGQTIMFICPHGPILNGSNSSTCMGNGEWEPDPRKVECTGRPVTIATMIACNSSPYVLRISDPVRVIKETSGQEFDDTNCCSGFLITSANNTICLENGEWELDTTLTNEGMIAMLRTALISVTCVLVVMSVLTIIAGIVCYHYISQRWRAARSADINKQPGSNSNPKDTESELELKENVAYITLRPAA